MSDRRAPLLNRIPTRSVPDPRWFRPSDLATNEWPVRYARTMVDRCEPTAWASAWRALAHFDSRSRLPQLTVPTLCIAGELDVSAPPSMMVEIAALVHGGRAETISAAPHLFSLTHAAEAADHLNAFARRIGR